MWRAVAAKIMIGALTVCTAGGIAGMGLANYVESGAFRFYKRADLAEWRPAPRPAVQTTDLAYGGEDVAALQPASFER